MNLTSLKQRIPLLDYLHRRHWVAQRVSPRSELVGLCPLHPDSRPSFYVNPRKNLFYCHGCGRGGDLIRLVELSEGLSFRQSLSFLCQQIAPPPHDLLQAAADFSQFQLHRYPEASHYLLQRGLRDPEIIQQLGIGYAHGGSLRHHLMAQGFDFDLLLRNGLINSQGRDTFCRRVLFPCRHHRHIVNFYGRSIGQAFPHRLLPRPKGDLFAWNEVSQHSSLILVEGLFDLAVLWQAGFRNTTSPIGTHLTPAQWSQLCDGRQRLVYIAFDHDDNDAGQQASRHLAARLHRAGLDARIVRLPTGHDPNSYFAAGASPADFARLLEDAR